MIPFQRPEPVDDAAVRDGDDAACLLLLGQIGNDERIRGNLPEAETALSEAVALARTHNDRQRLAVNLVRLATARQYQGRHDAAEPFFREALTLTKTRAASDDEDFALQHLGTC